MLNKEGRSFTILLLTLMMPILGMIMLFQKSSSVLDRIGAFNFICGGLLVGYWLLAPKITETQRRDSAVIIWFTLFTAYQLWVIFALYILVSKKWKLRLRKGCTYFFIVLMIYLCIYTISKVR